MRTQTLKLCSIIFALFAVCGALSSCGGGGGGGGSSTAPPPPAKESFLSITHPANASKISDVDFRATDTFYIEITHTAPLMADSLSVTFKMDNGAPQNITGYFVETNATTLRSSAMTPFVRGLFVLASNDVERVMTITATAKNNSGVSGTVSNSFTVFPDTSGLGGGGAGRAIMNH